MGIAKCEKKICGFTITSFFNFHFPYKLALLTTPFNLELFIFSCYTLPFQQVDRSRNRFVILLGCALLSVFGSNKAQFSGAGALGVLVLATMASYGWGDSEKVG